MGKTNGWLSSALENPLWVVLETNTAYLRLEMKFKLFK